MKQILKGIEFEFQNRPLERRITGHEVTLVERVGGEAEGSAN